MSIRTASRIVLALAAFGLARQIWYHCFAERIGTLPAAASAPRPDARYAGVRSVLPRTGRVGYLSDEPVTSRPGSLPTRGNDRYQGALYALAPLILRYGDGAQPWVVIDAADPARVQDLCARNGLVIEMRGPAGVAVARPVRK
jgi:hypothetical protein